MTATADPIVELIDVRKVFVPRQDARAAGGPREVRAVDGVSLEVRRGECLAIVGRSGSGKSTLLSLIASIDAPSSGEVRFDGRPVQSLDDRGRSALRNRAIGFVFQSFHLIPGLTARENVAVPLEYSDVAEPEWTGLVDRALGAVGLVHRADHLPAELSGGEAQRVAIARALVLDPPLVVADEPTGNLDSATGEDIASLLLGLRGRRSVVLVTHDASLSRRADRAVELRDGRVVA